MSNTTHTHGHSHGEHPRHYSNIKTKKVVGSQVEITGEISAAEMKRAFKESLKAFSEQASVPGFRKGHVPADVILNKMGEMAVLEHAAEGVLSHEYMHIVVDHKIEAISRPQIELTKIAKDAPLEFKITVAVFPEVKMPDYKKIAKTEMKKEEKIEITDKEFDGAIDEIHKTYGKKEGATADAPLAPLDDALIQTLGDFKNLAEFKTKLKENMLKEKEYRAKEKKRLQIGENIVAEMTADLPEVLVSSELAKMWGEFEHNISRMGLKIEDYLKHIKKTREELSKEWRKDAEKRVSLQIALNRIVSEEKLLPSDAEVTAEVEKILAEHKDADAERARAYVEMVLGNEKAFRFLEEQK
ncbi:MAG: trigger factor [bacterium]